MPTKTKPTVGDIVAFVLPVGHKRAGEIISAQVTHVASDEVVSVSPLNGVEIHATRHDAANLCSNVPFAELPAKGQPTPRTWHWPAKPAAVAAATT